MCPTSDAISLLIHFRIFVSSIFNVYVNRLTLIVYYYFSLTKDD